MMLRLFLTKIHKHRSPLLLMRRLIQQQRLLAGSSTSMHVAVSSAKHNNDNNCTNGSFPAGVAWLMAAGGAYVTMMDTSTTTRTTTFCQASKNDNPMWPSGVSDDDVDAFVEQCLQDKTINIPSIPDFLERQIYRSTVKLTLNVLYHLLSHLHGLELFAHEFVLYRRHDSSHPTDKNHSYDIDEDVLEQVAVRLLSNKAINQAILPDEVEKQLYRNCLVLVFRLLDAITASFCITLCGHDLNLHLTPSKKSSKPRASHTGIDTDALKAYYMSQEGADNDGLLGDFTARLHASLYALILGIVDDLLANTDIGMLSDHITMDIIDGGTNNIKKKKKNYQQKPKTKTKSIIDTQSVTTFAAGVGVGAALVTFLAGR